MIFVFLYVQTRKGSLKRSSCLIHIDTHEKRRAVMLLCSGSFMCAYVSSKNNVNSLAVWKADGKRSSENWNLRFQTTCQTA
ncbi:MULTISPECIES: hypothetical protein [Neisseria]|uniref:Uncharacterized protein n=1 Tax=Neisseria macacae ATCC 33926 TaxID=997348 RepID=A0AA36ULQ5_9NEIS|nr:MULTISPECIES: hypothetical protein [Neisseria]EGQ78251.1 hypothetical protein HMPREF9418_0301 [Neisseria macacae ATCC 33926]UNV84647.1 hypothetical protein MON40_11675 [Neisseria macacae ATCC 33926]